MPRSSLAKLLLNCAGVDLKTLEQCPSSENAKLTSIGGTVLLTAVMAFFSGSFALHIVTQNWWMAVPAAFIYALIIFNLDRFIVASIVKTGTWQYQLLHAAPRIFLAMIFAFSISKPLELELFKNEINTRLTEVAEKETSADQDKIDVLTLAVQTLKAENDSLQNNPYNTDILKKLGSQSSTQQLKLQEIEQEHNQALIGIRKKINRLEEQRRRNRELKEDTYGLTQRITTLSLQQNLLQKKLKDAQKEMQSLNGELQEQKSNRQQAVEKRIQNNNIYIADYQEAIRDIEQKRLVKIENFDGIMARLKVLSFITNESSAMWWTEFLVFLLLLTIETAPVFVKLLTPAGYYDQLLEKTSKLRTKATQHNWLLGFWTSSFNGEEIRLKIMPNHRIELQQGAKPKVKGRWKHMEAQLFKLELDNTMFVFIEQLGGNNMMLRDQYVQSNIMEFERSIKHEYAL